jgi:ABC-type glycerol-3-phosphate transport system substrate-binding protein
MKKILLVLGIAAMMAACGGNQQKSEPAQEEGTEMQMEGTEDQQQDATTPADTTSVETPAEDPATATPPPAQ